MTAAVHVAAAQRPENCEYSVKLAAPAATRFARFVAPKPDALAVTTRSTGKVEVEVWFDPADGSFEAAKVRYGHPLLIREVVEAARRWQLDRSQQWVNPVLVTIAFEGCIGAAKAATATVPDVVDIPTPPTPCSHKLVATNRANGATGIEIRDARGTAVMQFPPAPAAGPAADLMARIAGVAVNIPVARTITGDITGDGIAEAIVEVSQDPPPCCKTITVISLDCALTELAEIRTTASLEEIEARDLDGTPPKELIVADLALPDFGTTLMNSYPIPMVLCLRWPRYQDCTAAQAGVVQEQLAEIMRKGPPSDARRKRDWAAYVLAAHILLGREADGWREVDKLGREVVEFLKENTTELRERVLNRASRVAPPAMPVPRTADKKK